MNDTITSIPAAELTGARGGEAQTVGGRLFQDTAIGGIAGAAGTFLLDGNPRMIRGAVIGMVVGPILGAGFEAASAVARRFRP